MILETQSLSKKIDSKTIITGIDIQVHKGDFISVIGPSGCGKTTFLNLLAGLDSDYQGIINIDRKKRLSYVFQSSILLPWLTLLENVRLPLKLKGCQVQDEKINEVIKKVGLEGFESYFPHKLSGGMQKRASIACALSTFPDILLLDEPFSGLDFINRSVIIELFYNIFYKESPVIMTTHFIEDAIMLSNKILLFPINPFDKTTEIEIDMPFPRMKNEIFFNYEKTIKDYYTV